ncbi:MAG: hypothetical protein EOO46_08390 [Flavobacterium sp.]|nr:MAG: hypothetical protein EOO46_08390 [Flavobacterium sp.]
MKKLLLPLLLFVLNLMAYFYLTEYVGINSTFEEMATILVIMIIIIPLGVLPIAGMQYYFKRSNPQLLNVTTFKEIFIQLYLLFLSIIYAMMLSIAVMIYIKMQQ